MSRHFRPHLSAILALIAALSVGVIAQGATAKRYSPGDVAGESYSFGALAGSGAASGKSAPANLSLPTISGTPTSGETLAATIGSWSGKSLSYAYSWQRCDSLGINCLTQTGTTSASYTLGVADVGSNVRVVVTATNRNGTAWAASPLTATIAAAAGGGSPAPADPPVDSVPPSIAGAAASGGTLTGSAGSWTGAAPIVHAYQWQRCNSGPASCAGISGATSTTYSVGAADVGSAIRLSVTGSNSYGSQTATSALTAIVPGPTASAPSWTTAPAITGTAQDGQTLSSSAGAWTGTSPISYGYQWRRCDSSGSTCSNIAGATSLSLVLGSGDVGSTIRMAVTASNSAGTVTSTSSQTTVVAPAPSSTPPPASGVVVGLNGYPSGNTTEQSRILDSGVKLVRTDRDDFGISWAHSHGLTVDGIIWMSTASAGMSSDVIELDNEPYYNNWNGLGGVEQWAAKARDVAKAVKAQYPNKKVLLPALAVTNNGDVLDNGVWTPMLYAINHAAPDIWQYVDGIAIHPYTRPNGPSAILSSFDRLRSQLQTVGGPASSLPFWITEIGWTNTGDVAVSESTAATYMQQLVDAVKARTDVAALIAYTASDNPSISPASEQGYGIYRSDGTAKPVQTVIKAAA